MSDTSGEHTADSLEQTHSTATTTAAASTLKEDAVEMMPITRTSPTLLARDGRGGGAREQQQQQQQSSPTTSNASVLVRSTSPSTSTTTTSWPQASSAGSCLSSSCTASLLSSQQQQQGSHHCHAQHNSHHHQQQQHSTPQPPRNMWQTAVAMAQKMAAVRGKPWIALGVCIIAVELVVLIGMFSSMPIIDEYAELTTAAVQEVLRAGAEWVTPEAWSHHLVLNLMASDALITLFRVRVALVANASRPHALEQALHSLVTSKYSRRNAAVDLHVYVHADTSACTSASNDDNKAKDNEDEAGAGAPVSACEAQQQLHAETMRTLDSVAWTHGRYEVHLVSGSDDCAVHGGKSSSSNNTTPGCAARMLRSLWYPTSMWEVALLLDDHVRLSPLWYVQLTRLMRSYVVRDGIYKFLMSYNAYAPALNDDGTPRQWHMEALTARNARDTLLGLALHDTFPVAASATTATGTAPATAAAATTSVQLDVLTRAGNGVPYLAQLAGMYGTLFLPYSWRSMITWLQQQQQQQQQQQATMTARAGGNNDNTAAADTVAAAVLPGWRSMQRYVEAQGVYVLYPSSPNNAAVATLDVDAAVYKSASARAYARSQQLPDSSAVGRQNGNGDGDDDDGAAGTSTQNRSALDRYDASGALLLRNK